MGEKGAWEGIFQRGGGRLLLSGIFQNCSFCTDFSIGIYIGNV